MKVIARRIIHLFSSLERLIFLILGDRYSPKFHEFIRFSLVGLFNFLIDVSILNMLSFLSGRSAGTPIIIFNTLSFSTAVTSSYFLNKHWTFNSSSSSGPSLRDERRSLNDHTSALHAKEFIYFILVNIVGLGVNTGIVYAITTFLSPFNGINPHAWLTLAKIAAVPFGMVFNFFGPRNLVFRKQNPAS